VSLKQAAIRIALSLFALQPLLWDVLAALPRCFPAALACQQPLPVTCRLHREAPEACALLPLATVVPGSGHPREQPWRRLYCLLRGG
jgi:hypothetical protein